MKLLLLFSPGSSLEEWERDGYLSRELDVYGRLARRAGEVWWYTYGVNDRRYESRLAEHGLRLFPPDERLLHSAVSPRQYDRQRLMRCPELFAQFDVVKTNQYAAWRLGAALKGRFGTRLIIRRGYWFPLHYRLATRRPLAALFEFLGEGSAYRIADRVIVTSSEARQHIVRLFQMPPEKIEVIPNGMNTATFEPLKDEAAPSGSVRLLYVGRLVYQKNPESLLRAMHALSPLPLSLTMIGTGRYRTALERQADCWGLRVEFKDRVDNQALPQVYASHDIFILPSRWEGHPKALLEAMACGRCVIAADVFGSREVVRHGETGLLYQPGAAGLAQAIATVAHDEPLRRRLGEAARQFILNTCQLDEQIEHEARLLRSLVLG